MTTGQAMQQKIIAQKRLNFLTTTALTVLSRKRHFCAWKMHYLGGLYNTRNSPLSFCYVNHGLTVTSHYNLIPSMLIKEKNINSLKQRERKKTEERTTFRLSFSYFSNSIRLLLCFGGRKSGQVGLWNSQTQEGQEERVLRCSDVDTKSICNR